MVVEESKEADKTTGEATHRISRGISDKVMIILFLLSSLFYSKYSFFLSLDSVGLVCSGSFGY